MLRLSGLVLFSKLLIAGLNFCTIILISRFLGPVEKGVCSWYLVIIAISLVFSEMISGPTAGFLINRFNIKQVRFISYTWSVVSSFSIITLFYLLNKVNSFEACILFFLCWLNAANTIHQHLFLAVQNFRWFNSLSVLAPLLVVCLLIVFLLSGFQKLDAYLYSLFVGWSLAFIAGYLVLNRVKNRNRADFPLLEIVKEGFRKGVTNQASHLVSLLNSRLIFFLLPATILGVYSNALSLAEASMMIPGSLGQVMYASILNKNTDKAGNVQMNFWITTGLSLSILIFVLIIPGELYQAIFGESFAGVKSFLVYLSGAMIFLSGYLLLSYWQSAHGRFLQNLHANLFALFTNGLISVFFILKGTYSIEKGILAMFIALVVQMLVSMVQFHSASNRYDQPVDRAGKPILNTD
ncbi:MAG: hypothetical protein V4717_09610 [Bacteroidota bacterium]